MRILIWLFVGVLVGAAGLLFSRDRRRSVVVMALLSAITGGVAGGVIYGGLHWNAPESIRTGAIAAVLFAAVMAVAFEGSIRFALDEESRAGAG